MNMATLMTPFEKVSSDYYGYAKETAAAGRKVAGYMCSYAPQELLHAAGYLPIRILGREGDTHHADELLQAFSCSFARSVLDSALEQEWPFLDLVMFSHTCDTMQNVADLWRAHAPHTEVLIASVPTRTDGDAALRYYMAELKRLKKLIELKTGPITNEKLTASLQLFDDHRNAMQELYTLRTAKPELLSGAEMMNISVSAFLMDRAEHLVLIREVIDVLKSTDTHEPTSLPRIFVAGGMCRHVGFIELMEKSGCVVVGDDLCVGSRSFSHGDNAAADPMEALARVYLDRIPCPAFHRTARHPGDALV
ncbi:MAG: 2-hydroxyacyl-CoA dehydratase, partial [Candidatus Hydrogenedentes bacterium]|nr:2-hydroxyacyl-CoA dehydratase [Candidatus Hydrogenedentota bacterium]